jgi:putative methionine-R-sulfoxide reductase with GAF domain
MIPMAYREKCENSSNGPQSFNISGNTLGRIVDTKKAVIINDLHKESQGYRDTKYCTEYKSCILVPMRRLNKCIGCMGIFSD